VRCTLGEIKIAYKILYGKLKTNRSLWRVGVDGRILLKCILKKQGVDVWTGFNWLKTRTDGGLL
jgi:hypothetical protein